MVAYRLIVFPSTAKYKCYFQRWYIVVQYFDFDMMKKYHVGFNKISY